jgi:hypothetical protein
MRSIKRALDPSETLNPGKLLADQRLSSPLGSSG